MTEKTFTPPEIDYLSKDYASFRQVMRDQLAALIPDWQEQNPSDIGNALVDLLAYAGDYLSYYQDAVATEAYLGTARRRVSVHRHARLLDYDLHEGCNARALVQVQVNAEVTLPKRTQLVTRGSGPTVIVEGDSSHSHILGQPVHFFETMHTANLKPAHNEIRFYVPEGAAVHLPVGATHAILQYDIAQGKKGQAGMLNLQTGDILVFREIRNPETGSQATADPTHRHAVRLTQVFSYVLGETLLVDINWHPADALPSSLVLKRYAEREQDRDVSTACGNIILADHGRTMCEPLARVEPGERYEPRLTDLILTYCESLALNLPVRESLRRNPRKSKPAVQLWQVGPRTDGSPQGKRMPVRGRKDSLVYDTGQARTFLERPNDAGQVEVYQTTPWTPRHELLSSDPTARDYQVELIDSREARLKFGFGGMGWQPQPGDEFIAAFRVGSGVAGNVGVGAIAHIILPKGSADGPKIKAEGVSNLLPADGGQGRESLETARLLAPASLQTQARCVTLADYEEVARLHPDVAEASAHWKWITGAHIVVLHIHRKNGLPVDRAFQQAFLDYMRPYQIVGSDIQVRGPHTWPVYLWLQFKPTSYASENGLRESLKVAFSDQNPDGFFYPQKFSLGQPLYRSQIITHASQLTGIQDIRLVHFCNEPFGKERVEQVIPVPATAVIGLQALEIQVESNDD